MKVSKAKLAVRKATAEDQPLIDQMIKQEAGLDPSDLGWPHFVIAEIAGEAVGCGQIRPYAKGPELGSIYTRDKYRGKGVADAVIRRLIDDWERPGPLYLECRGHMAPYYERFGFERIRWQDVPGGPLRFKAVVGSVLGKLLRIELAVMRLNR
jgi:N-acetylglutamate synthase-like GNAT family acetyltransferase